MATKGKEDKIPGKEKRGKSPSYPRSSSSISNTTTTSTTVQRKRSPSLSPGGGGGGGGGLPDHHKQVPTTPTAADPKHVPNYLKPTLSSGPDPSSKKPNKPQKPTLNRRRSFDKPPSPSGLPKTLDSPSKGERSTLRSLFASPRNTSLAKPHSESLSKAPKDIGKSHCSLHDTKHASTRVRKNTTNTNNIKNKNLNTASSTSNSALKKLSSGGRSSEPDDDTTPVVESQEEDQESSITEDVEEEGAVLKEVELLPNEISMVDKDDNKEEHVEGLVQGEPKNCEDEVQVKASCEISKFSEEEHENEALANNHNEEQPFDKDHAEGEKEEVEEEEEEEEHDKSAMIEEIHPEVAIEDKEGKEDGNENSEETSVKDEGNEMPKEEQREIENVVNVGATNHGQIKKKESPAAHNHNHNHNDVIEETASKFLEKRKNKVKALVGAFETVISLQDPEPSNPNASKEDLPK